MPLEFQPAPRAPRPADDNNDNRRGHYCQPRRPRRSLILVFRVDAARAGRQPLPVGAQNNHLRARAGERGDGFASERVVGPLAAGRRQRGLAQAGKVARPLARLASEAPALGPRLGVACQRRRYKISFSRVSRSPPSDLRATICSDRRFRFSPRPSGGGRSSRRFDSPVPNTGPRWPQPAPPRAETARHGLGRRRSRS